MNPEPKANMMTQQPYVYPPQQHSQGSWYEDYPRMASSSYGQVPPSVSSLQPPAQSTVGTYIEPYQWMESFLPYWERSHNIPFDPYRSQRDNPRDVGGCATVFVRSLPADVTKRELELVFRFMPNFVRVRLLTRADPIAFVDFADIPSAHAALITLQGFFLGNQSINIQYDRDHRQ